MAKYEYRRGTTKFVNPYNFVRMDIMKKNKTSDSEGSEDKLMSGVLHCSFETKTPLAIPDVELRTADNTGHYTYPFYTINGVPSVPGSSIRGMVRSMYETLTDSCYVTLADNESITARVSPGKNNVFEPAILLFENDAWNLYKADRYTVKIGKNFSIKIENEKRYLQYGNQLFETGEQVDITSHQKNNKEIVDTIKKSSNSSYYLYVGEPMEIGKNSKKNESVFKKGEKIDLSSEEISKQMAGLSNTVKMYQNKAINKNLSSGKHTGYKNFEDAKKRKAICVWYKKETDGRIYLSMAAIGRKSYNNTVNDMIGEHRNPCKERNNLCPACKLFGMVKGEGCGSKIRITDAQVKGDFSLLGKVCLKELGSPRTGYYPFYTSNGKEYDQQGVVIAGRKYYWHIPKASNDASVYKTSERTERNATMELMGVGTTFTFDVYYDNVTQEQLDEIKWVLALPDESGNMMHKLGHGKPLGLGSIKISIDSEERREFDGENYTVKKERVDNFAMSPRIENNAWKQISVLCNYDTMKDEDVRYPYIEVGPEQSHGASKQNDFAAHQWFTSNKGRKKEDPKPMTLANVKDKSKWQLKVYVPELSKENNNNSKNSGRRRGNGRKYR